MAWIKTDCWASNPDGYIGPSRTAMARVRTSTGVARLFLSRTYIREAMAQRYYDATALRDADVSLNQSAT